MCQTKKKWQEIRRDLHQRAELAGQEQSTAEYLLQILDSMQVDELKTGLAGHGIIATFVGAKAGPSIAIRADMDALPIQEDKSLVYHSFNEQVSHKCGHDGHMSIALAVCDWFAQNKDQMKGRLVAIFQPAEETGEGAALMLQHLPTIDYCLGLHNIPGEKLGKLLISHEIFACASAGMKVNLPGISSHAAEPDKASNFYPHIQGLYDLTQSLCCDQENEKFQVVSLTYLQVGQRSFGLTPGPSEIYLTLRSYSDQQMNHIKAKLEEFFRPLKAKIEYCEVFPAVVNSGDLGQLAQAVASEKQIAFQVMDFPFRWSEDFAHYQKVSKTFFWGIGSGQDQLHLHHPDYDFNDELVEKALYFYQAFLIQLQNQ